GVRVGVSRRLAAVHSDCGYGRCCRGRTLECRSARPGRNADAGRCAGRGVLGPGTGRTTAGGNGVTGERVCMLTFVGIVLFVVLLLGSVAIHEFGHCVSAKIFGMKVSEYFVGFGPKLWSFRRGET